jgi:hypothetical protein
MEEKKGPGGRPTNYCIELAQEICEQIATRAVGITQLCNDNPHFPSPCKLFDWIRKYPEFRNMYAQAKRDQAEVSVDKLKEWTDEEHIYTDEHGNRRVDVPLLRVKIDTVKWEASKLIPRVYGERGGMHIEDSDSEKNNAEVSRRIKDLEKSNEKEY